MKKYEVIALSVGGLGNKVFSCGEIVQENNFVTGRAEELVRLKFLKPLEVSVRGNVLVEQPKEIEGVAEEKEMAEEKKEAPSINDVKSKELKEWLSQKGISFKSNASKQELYDLWVVS